MGRHAKTVVTAEGLDRRSTGYYSTPGFVSEFIGEALLELNPSGRRVFDPCVGRGEMVAPFLRRGLQVDAMDLLPMDLPAGIGFVQDDFIEFYCKTRDLRLPERRIDLPYDFYVANPPYNCHESDYIRSNKPRLTAAFGRGGVLNMYSMFLRALIDCAKEGAVIGVITLDSFLTAKNHAPLRKYILERCTLNHVLLCPTDLFLEQGADVRTCIVTLTKGRPARSEILELNRPLDTRTFQQGLERRGFTRRPLDHATLNGQSDHSEILIGVPAGIRDLFVHPRLGGLFPCITGISTGADAKYLSPIERGGFSMPFYKNPGSRRFYTPPDAYLTDDYLEIDESVSNFIVRNKRHLLEGGITCSSMGVPFSAAYLPAKATYGVNANIIVEGEDRWWLMGYLNSSLTTYLVRGILNRSNMVTAGYVSRIPIIPLAPHARRKIGALARAAWRARVGPAEAAGVVAQIDEVIFCEAGLDCETVDAIASFCSDVIRAT